MIVDAAGEVVGTASGSKDDTAHAVIDAVLTVRGR